MIYRPDGRPVWAMNTVQRPGAPIFSRHSGKALDVSGISTDSGAQIVQWDQWGGDNQGWRR